MKVLDLFSGVGGFSCGLERAGMETVAFCEADEHCRKVLKKHWPDVPIFEDVTTYEFSEPVDLVTAGFPCQDISLAGKGAGLAGTRSGLYWHVLRTVRMVGFPNLLLENVAALLGRGMDAVLGSLAQVGYDAEWHCIPASAVGAVQERDRVWIAANISGDRVQGFFKGFPAGEFGQGRACRQEDLQQVYAAPLQSNRWPQPLLCGGRSGVPNWAHRIKQLGNSVYPAIPEMIGRAIMAAEAQA